MYCVFDVVVVVSHKQLVVTDRNTIAQRFSVTPTVHGQCLRLLPMFLQLSVCVFERTPQCFDLFPRVCRYMCVCMYVCVCHKLECKICDVQYKMVNLFCPDC